MQVTIGVLEGAEIWDGGVLQVQVERRNLQGALFRRLGDRPRREGALKSSALLTALRWLRRTKQVTRPMRSPESVGADQAPAPAIHNRDRSYPKSPDPAVVRHPAQTNLPPE